jgi:hypothetical protein
VAAGKSLLRRGYDALALVAVLHLLAVAGAGAYAIGTGLIDRPSAVRAWNVLRGRESPQSQVPPASSVSAPPTAATASPEIQTTEDLLVLRRQADRIKTELDQQLALVQSIMLKVANEREALDRENVEAAVRTQRGHDLDPDTLKQQRQEGFAKQVEIIEGLEPKVALEHLVNLEDVDEAAKLLAAMDARKVQKIVGAAKTPDRVKRIQTIVRRIQDVIPMRTAASDVQEP